MEIHFYDTETGLIRPRAVRCSPAQLKGNTPPGCSPIFGVSDPFSQRVDLATGEVVDYRPPSPGDDELRTWGWHADTKRWVATKTVKAIAKEARAERTQRLAASDWVVTEATENAKAIAPDWKAYRKALRDVPEQAGFPQSITWPTPPES